MYRNLCEAPSGREHVINQTARGNDVPVGRLCHGDTESSGRPVSLGIARSPGSGEGVTAALTAAEARQLADALLQQAAAADGSTADAAPGEVEVSYLGGESYAAAARGHTLLTDQPATAGGKDTAMTPTELLVAALSSCVAFYAGRYLARHGLNRDGLHVTAVFTTATDRPARVGAIRLTIRVPVGIPPNHEAALLAVTSHCTVHNTLRQTLDIAIELS